MIVLDASVAVKLVALEPGSDVALKRVRSEAIRYAPDWVRMEVANALSRKVRQGALDPEAAERALCTLPSVLTAELDSLDLLGKAFAISIRIKHGLYDCLYLAAAVDRDAVVLTADKQFAEHAASGGFADQVELLA